MEEVSRAQERVFSLVEPAALKGEKGGSFYTIPQKLVIGNYPVETGTFGFGSETSSF
jgi:hypothetical protein